jgi:DNA-binding NarL/FixJ family response regulator
MLRILIADDHEIVRAGFAQFIADQGDMQVTGEASSGDEAIVLIRRQEFDVVLLDISMPDKNGIDCLRVIRQTHPALAGADAERIPREHLRGEHAALRRERLHLEERAAGRADPRHPRRGPRQALPERDGGRSRFHELANPSDKKLHETLSEREFQIFHKLASGRVPPASPASCT